MKTNKPKVQKKVAKKAGKKELAKTLADKFLQAMDELGKEAEKLGLDIGKVGLAAIKKLSSQLSGEKATKKVAARDAKVAKKAIVEHIKPAKKETSSKNDKKVDHELKSVKPVARPAAQSVKVNPILTEENAAKALAKKAPTKKAVPAAKTKKPATDVKPK